MAMQFLAFGYWLLAIGFWLLVLGVWLSVVSSRQSGEGGRGVRGRKLKVNSQ
jgi:uncharacterized membrane protein